MATKNILMSLAEIRHDFCMEFAKLTDELGVAARDGDIVAVEQAAATRDAWRADACTRLDAAAANGHVAVLQLLKDRGIIDAVDFNFECVPGNHVASLAVMAALFEQTAVLDWLADGLAGELADGPAGGLAGKLAGFVRGAINSKMFVALQWALNRGLIQEREVFLCEDEEVLKWFARRLPEGKFARSIRPSLYVPMMMCCMPAQELEKRKKMWRDVRRESELAVVLAGRRRSLRLPPELWELVDENALT